MSIKKNLKKAMEEAKMNAAQLAKQTGISKGSISMYLSGTVTPKPDKLDLMAGALSVTVEDLLRVGTEPADGDFATWTGGKLTVQQAAKIMGKSPEFVQYSLQNKLVNWGYGVNMTGGRWSYCIYPNIFFQHFGTGTASQQAGGTGEKGSNLA